MDKILINIIGKKFYGICQGADESLRLFIGNNKMTSEFNIALSDFDKVDTECKLLDLTTGGITHYDQEILGFSLSEKIVRKSIMGSELYYILEIRTKLGLITSCFRVISQTIPNGVIVKRKININDLNTINIRRKEVNKETLSLLTPFKKFMLN